MKIESDRVEILAGLRWGKTIGSPIALLIENKDYQNWQKGMSPELAHDGSIPSITRPRPGHADLTGAMKYGHHDMRNILERSSARETAMRVALGAIAKKFLHLLHISIGSFVTQIGDIRIKGPGGKGVKGASNSSHPFLPSDPRTLKALFKKAEESSVRCSDEDAGKKMIRLIDSAIKSGDSLGGVFQVFVLGVPAGLGSHIQWDKRLDGRLARALMSIQAIKGVDVGLGFEMSRLPGSEVMDEIFFSDRSGFYRKTNNAGGLEGGMTDGMPILLSAAMKPIPTLRRPLRSVDVTSKKAVKAAYERSDICAVPAAGVIGEAMVALTIADAFLEKFGGDSLEEIQRNYDAYIQYIRRF
jgi:chorismate synthase